MLISNSGSLVKGEGGQTRNRTRDTRIFSPLLYRLSYLAVKKGIFELRNGAEEVIRTPTSSRTLEPESSASTNSATSAFRGVEI